VSLSVRILILLLLLCHDICHFHFIVLVCRRAVIFYIVVAVISVVIAVVDVVLVLLNADK